MILKGHFLSYHQVKFQKGLNVPISCCFLTSLRSTIQGHIGLPNYIVPLYLSRYHHSHHREYDVAKQVSLRQLILRHRTCL